MNNCKPLFFTILIILSSFNIIRAQSGSSDDFSTLDSLMYIPFDDNSYMKFGGEVREFYEYYSAMPFVPIASDPNGYLLQRYMLSVRFHISNNFSLFGEIKSGIVSFKQSPPSPVDKDKLDLHQLYTQVRFFSGPEYELTLRFGRQEINYGRMVSVREGPNVRLSFDAVRLMLKAGKWRGEALFAKPVEVDPGIFDDGWLNPEETLWGIRLSRRVNLPFNLTSKNTTFYYLGQHRERAVFAQGIASATRHTIGVRLGKAVPRPTGYTIEAAFQWGTFGSGSRSKSIRAWLLAFEGSLLLPDWPLQPRLGLVLQAASGDQDPTDDLLQTFSAPYPSRRLFANSYIGIYSNLYHLQPSIALHPFQSFAISFIWDFFWRQSVDDAVYAASGRPIPKTAGGNAYFIGHRPRVQVQFKVGKYLTLETVYAYFAGGPVWDMRNAAASVHYLAFQATFRF